MRDVVTVTAPEVYRTLNGDDMAIDAMVKAERTGRADVRGFVIILTGYQRDAETFCAATALYAVRY
jgi:hypothetical protein